MNQLNSSTTFFFSLLIAISALFYGAYSFFSGMNTHSVLIQNGTEPSRKIINHYKYDLNLKGLIFSLTFLASGISLFTMIVLPDKKKAAAQAKMARSQSYLEPQGSRIAEVAEAEASRIQTDSDVIKGMQGIDAAPPPPIIEERAGEPAVEAREVRAPVIEEKISEPDLSMESLVDLSDEEDSVVYGSGLISNEAIVSFVNNYPDSAVKFLYRRNLDGKSLTSTEIKIYKAWESRGMSQAKVKQYILSIMDWDKLPDEYLYSIWSKLRDRIFDLKLR